MAVFRDGWTPGTTDPATQAQVGFELSADVEIVISHVGCYIAAAGAPANVRASLWRVSDTTAVSDTGSVSTSGQPTSAWFDIPLPSPVAVPAGQAYVPAILVATAATFLYDPDDLTSPVVSGDGHVTAPATGGRFNSGSSFVFPSSTWVGIHGVRITYTLGGGSARRGAFLAFFG